MSTLKIESGGQSVTALSMAVYVSFNVMLVLIVFRFCRKQLNLDTLEKVTQQIQQRHMVQEMQTSPEVALTVHSKPAMENQPSDTPNEKLTNTNMTQAIANVTLYVDDKRKTMGGNEENKKDEESDSSSSDLEKIRLHVSGAANVVNIKGKSAQVKDEARRTTMRLDLWEDLDDRMRAMSQQVESRKSVAVVTGTTVTVQVDNFAEETLRI
ncbi:hypothetical protein RFI_17872 [Reticulomyxa filosa]|uniref:Uncharacterized protein n=1 Tax=Reticulomyxa filosa TaxID=46433 RepID=X6N0E1_RETFI|nr:hypothetical protein RFI_17872 [Reticulomyxa filosa]|eukprot:ETO19358.1 hypothetical protein RFI_17872 [Reticulomyxa filosa]